MRIERHAIDDEYMKDMKSRQDAAFAFFATCDWAKKNPVKLSLLMSACSEAIAYACLLNPEHPGIPRALRLGAQAAAALFAAATASKENPVTVPLDDEEVTYTSRPDESTVHRGRWIEGFFLSILSNDGHSWDLLRQVNPELLKKSSTQGAEYGQLYMESLRAYARSEPEAGPKIVAAIHATDPERPDVGDADQTLNLDVPQMEVCVWMMTRNPKFTDALTRAVEDHKKYYSRGKYRRRDYYGYISLDLTALASMGRKVGLPIDVESPYLPLQIAQ